MIIFSFRIEHLYLCVIVVVFYVMKKYKILRSDLKAANFRLNGSRMFLKHSCFQNFIQTLYGRYGRQMDVKQRAYQERSNQIIRVFIILQYKVSDNFTSAICIELYLSILTIIFSILSNRQSFLNLYILGCRSHV